MADVVIANPSGAIVIRKAKEAGAKCDIVPAVVGRRCLWHLRNRDDGEVTNAILAFAGFRGLEKCGALLCM